MLIYFSIIIYKNKKLIYSMILLPHHRIRFSPVDPLGDGLGDDIAAERREPEAITSLADPIDASELSQKWSVLLEEVKTDPEWFDFASE